MALSEKLLEKLVCPNCRGKLRYLVERDQLICEPCGLAYRIDNGVPVLLVDEAEKLK